MNSRKPIILFTTLLILTSFTLAIDDIQASQNTLNPGESYEITFDTDIEDGEEVEVTERIIIDSEEVKNSEKTVTIGEEERELPYIREIDLGQDTTYFTNWELDIQKDGSSNFASFEVEPHNTLTEITLEEGTDIVTPGSYEDISDSLTDKTNGETITPDDFDEEYQDENDKAILLGEPSELDLIDRLGSSSAEIKTNSQLDNGELILANLETEKINTVIISGEDNGIDNSYALLNYLENGELEDVFEDQATATLTEAEFSEEVSSLANIGLSLVPPTETVSGDPVDFDITVTNNEEFVFNGEVFIDHQVFDEQENSTESIEDLSGGESIDIEGFRTGSDYQPGENLVEIEVRDNEENVLDSFSDSFEIFAEELENALRAEAEITRAEFNNSLEADISVENLMDEEVEVERNVTHYLDEDTDDEEVLNIENASVNFSPGSNTDSFSLENNTQEGNNSIVVEYLNNDEEVIASAHDEAEVEEPDGPDVDISVSSFDSSLEVETDLEGYGPFTDNDLEVEYLKDDTLIFRESTLIDDHGDSQTESYSFSELETETSAVTGDSSIFGEHTFRADVLDAEGSAEETVEIRPEEVQERFDAGWNMISGTLSVAELRNHCEVIEFNGEEFWSFQSGEWENPERMDSRFGYYVYFESGCTAPLEDSASDQDFVSDETLSEGWNMISTLEEVSFDNLETSCEPVEDDDENIIWRYSPGSNDWERFDEDHSLKPFEGYFVKIEDTCQIEHTEHS